MTVLSLSIAFLSGAFTGAAGSYLADRFTDSRRAKQNRAAELKVWKDTEDKFPAVIADMREAFLSDEGKNVRAFFVKSRRTMIGFLSEPCFEFHTEVHPNLHAAMLHLARLGFITDISPGNTPMYRVHEVLVDWLAYPDNGRSREARK